MTMDYVTRWLAAVYPHADRRFVRLLVEILTLHEKKIQDYGSVEAGNLKASEAFGIPAYMGVLLRMEDKMSRLRKFARDQKLVNESFEDSLLDLANYALLCLILSREPQGGEGDKGCVTEEMAAPPPCPTSRGAGDAPYPRATSPLLPETQGEADQAGEGVAEEAPFSRTSRGTQALPEEQSDYTQNLSDLLLVPPDGYAGSKPYWFLTTIDKAIKEYESRWAK